MSPLTGEVFGGCCLTIESIWIVSENGWMLRTSAKTLDKKEAFNHGDQSVLVNHLQPCHWKSWKSWQATGCGDVFNGFCCVYGWSCVRHSWGFGCWNVCLEYEKCIRESSLCLLVLIMLSRLHSSQRRRPILDSRWDRTLLLGTTSGNLQEFASGSNRQPQEAKHFQ